MYLSNYWTTSCLRYIYTPTYIRNIFHVILSIGYSTMFLHSVFIPYDIKKSHFTRCFSMCIQVMFHMLRVMYS